MLIGAGWSRKAKAVSRRLSTGPGPEYSGTAWNRQRGFRPIISTETPAWRAVQGQLAAPTRRLRNGLHGGRTLPGKHPDQTPTSTLPPSTHTHTHIL